VLSAYLKPIVGLADIPTGGYAGKLAEQAGFRPKEAKAILDEYLTPEQQAANRAVSEAKGFLRHWRSDSEPKHDSALSLLNQLHLCSVEA